MWYAVCSPPVCVLCWSLMVGIGLSLGHSQVTRTLGTNSRQGIAADEGTETAMRGPGAR